MPIWLLQYIVLDENMDIVSICGAEHVPVVREDAEEVVRPTVWKEVLCGSGELVESGWYKHCTSEGAGREGCGDCEGGMLICGAIRSRYNGSGKVRKDW